MLDVQVHPGDTSLFHTHAEPILYVNFGTTQLRTQTYGQDWPAPAQGRGGAHPGPATPPRAPARPAAPPGPAVRVMSTTSYVDKPVTHRIQNVGTGFFHLIAVLQSDGGRRRHHPAGQRLRRHARDDQQVVPRVRFTLGPGEHARHQHAVPAVVVQAADGAAVATGTRTWGLNWADGVGVLRPKRVARRV